MKTIKLLFLVLVGSFLALPLTIVWAAVHPVPLATNSPNPNGIDACGGCTGGTRCCNTTCTNLSTDTSNCGSCGNVCSGGQTCTNGSCVSSCLSLGQSCSSNGQCCSNFCTCSVCDTSHHACMPM